MSTFVTELILTVLLASSASAQKPPTADDPSRITEAVELCTGSGKKKSGEEKYLVRIPKGDRLDEVFITSDRWITGLTFRMADGKDRLWGTPDDHHDHTHKLKDKEYITGVRAHTDIRIDWLDFITSQNRILHFGPPKVGISNRGVEALNIPPKSRVTGLWLFVRDRQPPEILRVEAFYQTAK